MVTMQLTGEVIDICDGAIVVDCAYGDAKDGFSFPFAVECNIDNYRKREFVSVTVELLELAYYTNSECLAIRTRIKV